MNDDPTRLDRRRWLRAACACCVASAGVVTAGAARAAGPRDTPRGLLPLRISRPDAATDEGGLWAMMDRQEAKLRHSPFVVRDAALQRYLVDVLCKLGGEHCGDTRLYTVRTPMFNASMAPNGMVQVWTGLLLRVDNEAQLATVLGHELGHYLQRHALARLHSGRSTSMLASLATPFGVAGVLGQYAAVAGYLSYSREHEREADAVGLDLMRNAGYDTREAAKVWAHLRAELAAGAGGDPAQKSLLFASHPGIDERQQTLEKLGADGSGVVGAQALRERVDPLLTMLLDDELQRAEYEQSLVLLDRLVALRPRHGELRYYRGEVRRRRGDAGDLALARTDFETALGEQCDNPPAQAHRSLGLVDLAQGRVAEGRAELQRYLELLPQAPDAGLVATLAGGAG
jgi:predicted Zn-dependent protease